MENKTKDGAGKTPEKDGQIEILHFTGDFEHDRKLVIASHMRDLQKKSAEARKRNDPDTYKKMAQKSAIVRGRQYKKENELKIILE